MIEISYSNSNLKHKFIYKDNGPGIEDSHKEKVFKLFETATEHGKRYGAGIGLTMVKAIIQKLGGTVSLADNSAQSSGVCFTLEIPIKH